MTQLSSCFNIREKWAFDSSVFPRNCYLQNLPCSIWHLVCFFGLPIQLSFWEIDLDQFMAQAVYRRVELIQLMTQAAFQGIDSESTHDTSRSPGIDSDRLMTQAVFQEIDSESTHNSSRSPGIESIQLMTQAKKLILSRLMIQLWVVPMSDMSTMHCWRNASGDTRY